MAASHPTCRWCTCYLVHHLTYIFVIVTSWCALLPCLTVSGLLCTWSTCIPCAQPSLLLFDVLPPFFTVNMHSSQRFCHKLLFTFINLTQPHNHLANKAFLNRFIFSLLSWFTLKSKLLLQTLPKDYLTYFKCGIEPLRPLWFYVVKTFCSYKCFCGLVVILHY